MADGKPRGFEIGENAYLLAMDDVDDFTTMLKVLQERQHQRGRGYTAAHDDEHSTMELVHFIQERLDQLPAAPEFTQTRLIQIAAIAVAAASSSRRQQQLRLM